MSEKPMVTQSESRESFMRRVRDALGRGRTASVAPPPVVDESIARLAGPDDDPVALFTERAIEVGMAVRSVALDAAKVYAVDRLKEAGATHFVASAREGSPAAEVIAAVKAAGLQWIDGSEASSLDPQFDADAGITDVDAALAETGTLICNSGSGRSRGPSLVARIHLAVIEPDDIVPDMFDYWPTMAQKSPAELPSSQAFITGPSKTADIEGELITGVHGPGEVLVLIVS